VSLPTKYLLVAYKADTTDYCMGCRMDSTSSEFTHLETDDIDVVIYQLGKIKFDNDWDEVYVYGPEKDIAIIYRLAETKASEIKEQKEKARKEELLRKKKAAAEAEKERELAQLKKLKEKYGG
jgi:hypothetical protein